MSDVITQLPAPLVPAEVDLRGLEYMPFFGNHLFGSEFNARCTDAEWRAGVTLWWAAWNQQPAGSLPDDDVALCRLADLGRDLKLWRKVKANALRGFLHCSDGRIYHPFLCKQVLVAWEKRVQERERKRKWREKKQGQDADGDGDKGGTKTGQDADVPAEGKGRDVTGRDSTSKSKALSGKPDVEPLAGNGLNGKGAHIPDAEDVMGYLNRTAGKGFEFRNRNGELTASAERIIARLKQGYTREELREVVFAKCEQWKGDEKMSEFLRPATLFAKENFEQYLGEVKGARNG